MSRIQLHTLHFPILALLCLVIQLSAVAARAVPLPRPTTAVLTQMATVPQSFNCSAITQNPQAECEGLIALHNSTPNGSNWQHNNGWLANNEPCGGNWHGVACNNGRISRSS